MADKIFTFHISPYETEKLLPQVSRALEKRTELVSRESCPQMWKVIDRLRGVAQGRSRSRLRTRVLSAVCLAARKACRTAILNVLLKQRICFFWYMGNVSRFCRKRIWRREIRVIFLP